MRNIWRLFCLDMRSLRSNVVSVVVVIGLLITPALYAWFNILGFWDPYSETDNLEVAVASSDQGYESSLFPTKINAGEEVISHLRADNEFEWVFTDEEDAVDGVKSGKYYAALVIPEQFSADLMTIFSGDIKHADIIYYTNKKENAVAPLVTSEGASAISVAINKAFTQTVASVALNTTSNLIDFVNGDGIANYGHNLAEHLDTIIADLNLASDQATAFADVANSTASVARTSSGILSSIGNTNSSVEPILNQTEAGLQDASNALGGVDADLEGAIGNLNSVVNNIDDKLDKLDQQIDDLGKIESPSDVEKALKDKLNDTKNKITTARNEIRDLKNAASAKASELKNNLVSKTNELSSALNTAKASILTLNTELTDITSRLSSASDSLADNLSSIGQSLEHTHETLANAVTRLTEARNKLQTALDSGDLAEVRKIIGSNPESIAAFVSSPAVLNRQAVYGVANNGSAFSPFYTSLAIWVGSVFMVALMKPEVSKKRQAKLNNPKPHQLYLGRYITFLLFALVQATIVCLGDVFFLGIQCVHIPLFFLVGWICALVFSSIVYTLTLSFGKVGECLAIILLVWQIAASGGIFPVVLSADFFQAVNPFLPFTYSLEAFQGAVAGIYGNQEVTSILMMLLFLIPMLFIGLVLRRPIISLNDWFTSKMEETKLL